MEIHIQDSQIISRVFYTRILNHLRRRYSMKICNMKNGDILYSVVFTAV